MNALPPDHPRGPVTSGDLVRFAVVAVYLLFVLALLLVLRRIRLPLSIRSTVRKLVDTLRVRVAFRGLNMTTHLGAKTAFSALVCPESGQSLRCIGEVLQSRDGTHSYPIVRDIPRFVSDDHYARSFSFEWNLHGRTQLDRFRGDNSSEQMFRLKTGLTPADVRGKLVLDAGVGAGRFADVLARWGATVVGVDLSYAVEAAQANLGDRPEVLICQADIGRLPFRPATFDVVVSIGVLHHTPDTRRYFNCLTGLVKPGGTLAVWVYPDEDGYTVRREWIPYTSRLPREWYYSFCKVFVPWALRRRESRLVRFLQRIFPFSNQGLGVENDILDTFDGYSPRYHATHTPEEVMRWFSDAGMEDVRALDWPTAVRGRQPIHAEVCA